MFLFLSFNPNLVSIVYIPGKHNAVVRIAAARLVSLHVVVSLLTLSCLFFLRVVLMLKTAAMATPKKLLNPNRKGGINIWMILGVVKEPCLLLVLDKKS